MPRRGEILSLSLWERLGEGRPKISSRVVHPDRWVLRPLFSKTFFTLLRDPFQHALT